MLLKKGRFGMVSAFKSTLDLTLIMYKVQKMKRGTNVIMRKDSPCG